MPAFSFGGFTPLQQNCRTMLQKLQKDLAPYVQFLQKK